MKRVTGIGGIFFKSKDPQRLREWYREHLGIESAGDGAASFHWRDADDPERKGLTVWSAFPQDTNYFAPSSAPFMINIGSRISIGCWNNFALKASKSIRA
jgi:hypothetical protein